MFFFWVLVSVPASDSLLLAVVANRVAHTSRFGRIHQSLGFIGPTLILGECGCYFVVLVWSLCSCIDLFGGSEFLLLLRSVLVVLDFFDAYDMSLLH